MARTSDDRPYALFHVNRKDGRKVRYPRESFPALPRYRAEELALGSRQAKVLTSAYPDDWETQALPDVSED